MRDKGSTRRWVWGDGGGGGVGWGVKIWYARNAIIDEDPIVTKHDLHVYYDKSGQNQAAYGLWPKQ